MGAGGQGVTHCTSHGRRTASFSHSRRSVSRAAADADRPVRVPDRCDKGGLEVRSRVRCDRSATSAWSLLFPVPDHVSGTGRQLVELFLVGRGAFATVRSGERVVRHDPTSI